MNPANSNSSRAASGPGSDAGAVSEGTVSLARIDRLRNSMPGKYFIIDELIELFVSDLPRRLGAMADAIERADTPALALQAHALRGSAANFGAARLDELCGRLEELGARAALAQAPAIFDALERESALVRDALLALMSKDAGKPAAAPTLSRRSV